MRSLRMTTRGLMVLVALVALSMGSAFRAMESNQRLKREVWARERLVASIDEAIRRPPRQSRSDFSSPTSNAAAKMHYTKVRPQFARLVWRPWSELPPEEYLLRIHRSYLDDREPALYGASFEHRYRRWSLRWAVVAGATMLLLAAVAPGIARRFRARRPRSVGVTTPILPARSSWLSGIRSNPARPQKGT